jgi:hypothetical protein
VATVLGVVAVAAAALWYVTAPPKGVDGYRERAAATAETLRSQVQLARIWVEAVEDDESTQTAALVGLEETELDAGSASSTFESYQPPSELVGLRSEFTSLADEATAALGELRVAAQQHEWSRVPELAEPLPDLAKRLMEHR